MAMSSRQNSEAFDSGCPSDAMEDIAGPSDKQRLDTGIDSSVVATVMSVADAKANTKFNTRHKFEYDYQPLPESTEFYFDEDGARHVDQLPKAGNLKLGATSSKPDKPMFVLPEDDTRAREERIKRCRCIYLVSIRILF